MMSLTICLLVAIVLFNFYAVNVSLATRSSPPNVQEKQLKHSISSTPPKRHRSMARSQSFPDNLFLTTSKDFFQSPAEPASGHSSSSPSKPIVEIGSSPSNYVKFYIKFSHKSIRKLKILFLECVNKNFF